MDQSMPPRLMKALKAAVLAQRIDADTFGEMLEANCLNDLGVDGLTMLHLSRVRRAWRADHPGSRQTGASVSAPATPQMPGRGPPREQALSPAASTPEAVPEDEDRQIRGDLSTVSFGGEASREGCSWMPSPAGPMPSWALSQTAMPGQYPAAACGHHHYFHVVPPYAQPPYAPTANAWFPDEGIAAGPGPGPSAASIWTEHETAGHIRRAVERLSDWLGFDRVSGVLQLRDVLPPTLWEEVWATVTGPVGRPSPEGPTSPRGWCRQPQPVVAMPVQEGPSPGACGSRGQAVPHSPRTRRRHLEAAGPREDERARHAAVAAQASPRQLSRGSREAPQHPGPRRWGAASVAAPPPHPGSVRRGSCGSPVGSFARPTQSSEAKRAAGSAPLDSARSGPGDAIRGIPSDGARGNVMRRGSSTPRGAGARAANDVEVWIQELPASILTEAMREALLESVRVEDLDREAFTQIIADRAELASRGVPSPARAVKLRRAWDEVLRESVCRSAAESLANAPKIPTAVRVDIR
eukprot:CAMPEP_0170570186 /NCGR_PEP_ID=MMETSP0224-20130122/972_1 /TAXON_ID=285029 /ORGANISM="Togula jolla, Strain CCCM 725" /LENGTH=523 /DNA_ID=CAMNT_0010892439 /DNA_START=13 /DNA_END=1584 /DNA_ORIENTATION=-